MFISLVATVGDAGAPAVLRAALRRLQAPTDPAERVLIVIWYDIVCLFLWLPL